MYPEQVILWTQRERLRSDPFFFWSGVISRFQLAVLDRGSHGHRKLPLKLPRWSIAQMGTFPTSKWLVIFSSCEQLLSAYDPREFHPYKLFLSSQHHRVRRSIWGMHRGPTTFPGSATSDKPASRFFSTSKSCPCPSLENCTIVPKDVFRVIMLFAKRKPLLLIYIFWNKKKT